MLNHTCLVRDVHCIFQNGKSPTHVHRNSTTHELLCEIKSGFTSRPCMCGITGQPHISADTLYNNSNLLVCQLLVVTACCYITCAILVKEEPPQKPNQCWKRHNKPCLLLSPLKSKTDSTRGRLPVRVVVGKWHYRQAGRGGATVAGERPRGWTLPSCTSAGLTHSCTEP